MHITSLHGGSGWHPRSGPLRSEIGTVWSHCGVTSECGKLRTVLMHCPGREIEGVQEPAEVLFLEQPDPNLAREQHAHLAEVYARHGVEVLYLRDTPTDKPNLYFTRDLFAMTPEGAILGRPASAARAGEECVVAKTLAGLRIPMLLSIRGEGTFEGGDLVIVNSDLAFVGEGLRTNRVGAEQAAGLLKEIGIGEVIIVQLSYATGHLDEAMAIVNQKQALLYPTRVSYVVWDTLVRHGFRTLNIPDEYEAEWGLAMNIVALEPGLITIPDGNPKTIQMLRDSGVECISIDVSELMKGGGAIRCMTAIIERDSV